MGADLSGDGFDKGRAAYNHEATVESEADIDFEGAPSNFALHGPRFVLAPERRTQHTECFSIVEESFCIFKKTNVVRRGF